MERRLTRVAAEPPPLTCHLLSEDGGPLNLFVRRIQWSQDKQLAKQKNAQERLMGRSLENVVQSGFTSRISVNAMLKILAWMAVLAFAVY